MVSAARLTAPVFARELRVALHGWCVFQIYWNRLNLQAYLKLIAANADPTDLELITGTHPQLAE